MSARSARFAYLSAGAELRRVLLAVGAVPAVHIGMTALMPSWTATGLAESQLPSSVVVRIEEQFALHLSLKDPSVRFTGST